MGLSQWDSKYLNPTEQQEVLAYQSQWSSDPNQQGSVHNVAEDIRARYGYSGGGDGSQYIPIDSYNPPKAPEIGNYESQYGDEIKGLMEQIKNPPKYESPYADLLNSSISDIMNRPKFDYNADTDEAYQAFVQRATAAGDKAYDDNLGGMSAMTGGRPNSWAGTVASQARNAYTLQAQEAVIQFEDRAYGRYKDEGVEMNNLVSMLSSQDQVAYGRYRDEIGDTKDLADMVLKLDDREFEQYKYMADQSWKVFDTEYQAYNDALTFKKDKISEAIDRSNILGFVNNKDSVTLGVPTGTLSQTARERAEDMLDYIAKNEMDITKFRKEKEISHEFDLKLMSVQENYKIANEARSGSGSGGGGSYSGGGTTGQGSYQPSTTETKTIATEYTEFTKFLGGDAYRKMNVGKQYKAIDDYIEQVMSKIEGNLYGYNSEQVGITILSQINNHPTVQKIKADYKAALAKVQGNKKTTPTIIGGHYTE